MRALALSLLLLIGCGSGDRGDPPVWPGTIVVETAAEHLARYPTDLDDDDRRAFAEDRAAHSTWVSPTMIVRISFVNETNAAVLEELADSYGN